MKKDDHEFLRLPDSKYDLRYKNIQSRVTAEITMASYVVSDKEFEKAKPYLMGRLARLLGEEILRSEKAKIVTTDNRKVKATCIVMHPDKRLELIDRVKFALNTGIKENVLNVLKEYL